MGNCRGSLASAQTAQLKQAVKKAWLVDQEIQAQEPAEQHYTPAYKGVGSKCQVLEK